jgi:hypothetical protein
MKYKVPWIQTIHGLLTGKNQEVSVAEPGHKDATQASPWEAIKSNGMET